MPLPLCYCQGSPLRRLWGDKFVRLADGILNETATGLDKYRVEVVKNCYALVEVLEPFCASPAASSPERTVIAVLPSATGHMTCAARQEGRAHALPGVCINYSYDFSIKLIYIPS